MKMLGGGQIRDYLEVGGNPDGLPGMEDPIVENPGPGGGGTIGGGTGGNNGGGSGEEPPVRVKVHGKGVFTGDVKVGGNIVTQGNITANGNVSATKLSSATSLEFGGGLSLSSTTIGNTKVISFGGSTTPVLDILNTTCYFPDVPNPLYTTYATQMKNALQLYGNEDFDANKPLNVLTLGFDSKNGFIDMAGTNSDGNGGPGLLINYHCGKNVYVGGTSGHLYVNNNLYALKNQEITGNLGVGVANPTQRIQAAGAIQSVNGNNNIQIISDGVHGILESTQDILINYYSGKDVIASGNLLSKGFKIDANKNTLTGWCVSLSTPNGSAWQTRSSSDNGKYLGFGITSSGWYYIAADDLSAGSNHRYPMHYEIDNSDPFGYRLRVNGTIYTNKVSVSTDSWGDYVFDDTYTLNSKMLAGSFHLNVLGKIYARIP